MHALAAYSAQPPQRADSLVYFTLGVALALILFDFRPISHYDQLSIRHFSEGLYNEIDPLVGYKS